jgi:HD-GYP domain-containing protein (c-di-GMP phosphodiesterase class II)
MERMRRESTPGRFWFVLRLGLMLAAASALLMALTVFAGKPAAWMGLATLLWLALFRVWRSSLRWEARTREIGEEMEAKYESVISALLAGLGLRANMTLEQSRRVTQLVAVLGWQMGLRNQEVLLIEKSAIVHDVGKIGIAETVLSKPGALTDQEWSEMKRHPELGYHLLKGIRDLEDVAEIVYAHHERWDGAGYPRGLRGEGVPLGARIFAVVDAYVAMTSNRPYRKAQPHSKAMQEILRNTGTQFDPEVVRAFRDAEERGLLDPDRQEDNGRSPAVQPMPLEA